jgi:hypothetical protein
MRGRGDGRYDDQPLFFDFCTASQLSLTLPALKDWGGRRSR